MRILRWWITLAVPIILIMGNVRLMMSSLWLQVEYNRPGFPADPYGFTTDERLLYGRQAIDYLIYREDIAFLGALRFNDGYPLFNERELIHMRDVQILTFWANVTSLLIASTAFIATLVLIRLGQIADLRRALQHGAWLTLALLLTVVVFALFGWELFFTGFHQLFFADGTWYFLTSDTLIRLFPEQFWFDTALAIGFLTILQASTILAASWLIRRKVHLSNRARQPL